MRHVPKFLLATLLLARPQPAHARMPAVDVPGVVQAGQRVAIRWDGLPGSAREVELELSLDGGRWLRLSPELEARDGRYVWRVPALTSAHARLRLRAGGSEAGRDFEDEVATSAEFRIESRDPVAAVRASRSDWWCVGEHAAARGWQQGRPATTLCDERSASVAENDSRPQKPHSTPAPASTPAPVDGRITALAPRFANMNLSSVRRQPLRL